VPRPAAAAACAVAAALAPACLALAGSARADAGVTLYAAGDIAYCAHPDPRWSGAAATAAVVEAALAGDPHAAVLVLGDNVYPRGSARAYSACYHPTWGRFKQRTWPAPGNREYLTPGARGYFDYFGSAAAAGYYRVQLGSWQVFSLDSNLGGAAHTAQLAWLKRELAAHASHCTLAYWHHPLYSSGGHGSIPHMRDAWDALYRAGAELVLSGHDHDYERFAPQDAHGRLDAAHGIRQFVIGTGGAYSTPFLWPLANSEVRDNSRSGVLRLRLQDGGYEWTFLEAEYQGLPNGRAPDRGTGRCHQARTD
jgi:hypothetical protein